MLAGSTGLIASTSGLMDGDTTNIILFGDSLEAHNGYASISAGSEEYSARSRGYYNWVRMFDPRGKYDNWYDATKTGRYFQGNNQGVSGNTTTQMAGRLSDVNNIPGDAIILQGGGTNDINQNDSTATILNNHSTCLANHKARGRKTLLITPPPRPLEGVDSWASGSAKRLAWFDVCDGMQALADADPNWVKIVRRDLICSNNDADRTPKTGYLNSDNVHLNPIGGYHVACDNNGVIDRLAEWISPFTDFPLAVQPGEITTNPTLSGSSGTVIAPCTGVAPNGMRFRVSSGVNITAVGSKETINGEEYFKIVITRNGSGGTETISLDYGANISSGLPAVGTWVRAAMKAKWNASTAIQNVLLQARQQPSTPANMNNYTMRVDSGYPWESLPEITPGKTILLSKSSGWWQMGPPMVIKSGITSILYNALITVNNATAGTDTIWISRMHLYSISDPRPALGF